MEFFPFFFILKFFALFLHIFLLIFSFAEINIEPQIANGISSVAAWGSVLSEQIERTLPSYSNDTNPLDGRWQIVSGTRFKFFVFSAFYDRREGKLIRIIGATKTRMPEKVWCRFIYKEGNSDAFNYRTVSVMARVKVMRCESSYLSQFFLSFLPCICRWYEKIGT